MSYQTEIEELRKKAWTRMDVKHLQDYHKALDDVLPVIERAVAAERERCSLVAGHTASKIITETYRDATRLYERAKNNTKEYARKDQISENARQVCCSRMEPVMARAIHEALTPLPDKE